MMRRLKPVAALLAAAFAALAHAEPLIRRHAVVVLGELIGPMGPEGLDPDDVAALSARITDLAAHDPDPDVRRLAGYRR